MQESSPLRRKAQAFFNALDHDRDGLLREGDLQSIAGRAAEAFGHAPGSAKARQLSATYLKLWKVLLAPTDADGDGAVSLSEYVAAIASAGSSGSYHPAMNDASAAFVDAADTNGDGELDRDEFARLYRSTFLGLSDDDIREAFAALDTDGSGSISTDEFKAGIREFLTDPDLDAPGSRLLGRL